MVIGFYWYHINAELWLPPSGHVEPDETPAQTVMREVQEELGMSADFLTPQPVFLTVTYTVGLTAGHTDMSLWFVLCGHSDREIAFDRTELHGVKWFHHSTLPHGRMEPNLPRFCKSCRRSAFGTPWQAGLDGFPARLFNCLLAARAGLMFLEGKGDLP